MNIFLFHGEFNDELPDQIFNCLADCDWVQLNSPMYPQEDSDITYSSDKLNLSPDLAVNLERYKNLSWIRDQCTRLVVNQLPDVSSVILTECITLDQVEIVRTAAKRLGHNLVVFTD